MPPSSSGAHPDGPPPGLPCTHIGRVLPEWIDYNGHMNVAYYVVLQDHGADGFIALVGLGGDFMARYRLSTFAIDARIVYRRELLKDAPVRCYSHLIDYDEKRMQVGNYLAHGEEGWVAAYSEWIYVQVDMETRRTAPFRPETVARLAELHATHRLIPRPAALARPFGLGRSATVSA